MTEYTFDKTKGQSAIEYLMTYGWMLLVVAIVGGAIFATVQGQCTQSTSGFTGGDVIVENFGIDSDGDLQLEVRNGGADTLTIANATVQDSDSNVMYNDTDTDIGVGSSGTIELTTAGTLQSSDGCNDLDLDFTYSMGSLSDQVVSGTLTDSIEFQ